MYNYNALLLGLFSCSFVRTCYYVVDHLLHKQNVYYDNLMEHRRLYVQKNIVKSVYLACMVVCATVTVVIPILTENHWKTELIHYFAVMYGSNDLVGLLCVPKLPSTTKIHHCVSTFLVLVSLSIDFQHSEIGQSMLVYTYASASAYIVNLHLGVRLLDTRGQYERLRYTAGVVYAITCAWSWSWHVWWAYTRPRLFWYHIVYISLLLWIVRDDIILMRWLTSI
jgi:hypothetical protein